MDIIREKYIELFLQLLEEWKSGGGNQAEFSKKTGISESFISQIKDGKKWLSYKRMMKLCNALDIPVEYFRLADVSLTAKENRRLVQNLIEQREKEIALILSRK